MSVGRELEVDGAGEAELGDVGVVEEEVSDCGEDEEESAGEEEEDGGDVGALGGFGG